MNRHALIALLTIAPFASCTCAAPAGPGEGEGEAMPVLGDQLDHVAAGDLEVAALVDPAAGRVHRRTLDRIAARDRPRLFSIRHRIGILTGDAL